MVLLGPLKSRLVLAFLAASLLLLLAASLNSLADLQDEIHGSSKVPPSWRSSVNHSSSLVPHPALLLQELALSDEPVLEVLLCCD